MHSSDEIVVVPHDAAWPARFRIESQLLHVALSELKPSIEHIGSTAVPGLAAKPIIDMLVGVESLAAFETQAKRLAVFGYQYIPEYERALPDRRFFKRVVNGVTDTSRARRRKKRRVLEAVHQVSQQPARRCLAGRTLCGGQAPACRALLVRPRRLHQRQDGIYRGGAGDAATRLPERPHGAAAVCLYFTAAGSFGALERLVCSARAIRSSALCPSHCAADRQRRRRAWALCSWRCGPSVHRRSQSR